VPFLRTCRNSSRLLPVSRIQNLLTGTIAPVFDGLDRVTSETTPQGSINYAYDLAGRRQTMTVAEQPAVNYTFDAANRPTQIARGSSTVRSSR